MFSFQFSPQPPKDYKQKKPLVMNIGLKYQTKKTHFNFQLRRESWASFNDNATEFSWSNNEKREVSKIAFCQKNGRVRN